MPPAVLARFRLALRHTRQQVYEELPIRQLETLLYVNDVGQTNLYQVAEALEIGRPAASGAVKALSNPGAQRGSLQTKRHELLEVEQDPSERRRIIIRVSPRGKEFLKGLASILEAGT